MFKENILRTIGSVLMGSGYRMTTVGKDRAYFMKRYSEDLAFYVRCRGITEDIGMWVDFFFTPITAADDNIYRPGLGIHIWILELSGKVTDEVMIQAGKKILAIESRIGSLSSMIMEELEKPYFIDEHGRYPIYKKQLYIYNVVKEDENLRAEFEELKKNVCKKLKRGSRRQAIQFGIDFVENLKEDYFRNKGVDFDFEMIRDSFCEALYEQCILDI